MIKIWHNGGWKWGGAGGRLRRWRIVRDLRNMTSVFHMEKAPKSAFLTLFSGSNEIQKKESRVEDSWWWRGGEGNLQSNTATYLAFWASPSWCWGLPASLGSLRLWEGNKRKRKSKNVDFGWKNKSLFYSSVETCLPFTASSTEYPTKAAKSSAVMEVYACATRLYALCRVLSGNKIIYLVKNATLDRRVRGPGE